MAKANTGRPGAQGADRRAAVWWTEFFGRDKRSDGPGRQSCVGDSILEPGMQ